MFYCLLLLITLEKSGAILCPHPKKVSISTLLLPFPLPLTQKL